MTTSMQMDGTEYMLKVGDISGDLTQLLIAKCKLCSISLRACTVRRELNQKLLFYRHEPVPIQLYSMRGGKVDCDNFRVKKARNLELESSARMAKKRKKLEAEGQMRLPFSGVNE